MVGAGLAGGLHNFEQDNLQTLTIDLCLSSWDLEHILFVNFYSDRCY